MYEDIPLTNNTAIHNFEITVDDHRAFIDYKQIKDRVFLLHTEVPHVIEGHGVAAALVEKTLKYIEDNHLKMVPYCQYIKVFLKRHPEWNRLLV
ncbi:MAG TPA: GNAT family N-acetyltransferase [Mucilaginibacter sp.]|jgi:predicted GNAT family acetyltransferase|nr:GNAT family N-acetyltransferase [Mucilaginibacter sp.]